MTGLAFLLGRVISSENDERDLEISSVSGLVISETLRMEYTADKKTAKPGSRWHNERLAQFHRST